MRKLPERKPRSAASSRDLGPSVGCDLGGTAIKVVRLRHSKVEFSAEEPTPSDGRRESVIETLARAILAAGGKGLRVGVAVPGFLDPTRRRVVRLSNVPSLDGSRLAEVLERRTGACISLDTDTNAGAVAEATLGAGRGFDRVLYITLGTGLGAAFAVDGRPVRVSRHTVGQIAHIPLVERGLACPCGSRGCAEAELSSRGILKRARLLGLRSAATTLALRTLALGGGTPREGRLARALWRNVGRSLARLATILGAFLSPELIVFGGGVSGAADVFLPTLERDVRRELDPRLLRRVELRAAALGRLSGAVGAALLAGLRA